MPYSLEPVKWSSKNTVFVISERLQKLFSGLTKRIVERRAESSTCVLHVRPAVLRPCNMKQARWLCSSMALQHKGHKTSRTRNTKTSSLNPFCLKCKDRFLKEFGYSFLIILYFSSKQKNHLSTWDQKGNSDLPWIFLIVFCFSCLCDHKSVRRLPLVLFTS